MQFPLCTKTQKHCVDKIPMSDQSCMMIPCSGLYTDVKKSEIQMIDKKGFETLMNSYKRYIGNNIPSIEIYSRDNFGENKGKV